MPFYRQSPLIPFPAQCPGSKFEVICLWRNVSSSRGYEMAHWERKQPWGPPRWWYPACLIQRSVPPSLSTSCVDPAFSTAWLTRHTKNTLLQCFSVIPLFPVSPSSTESQNQNRHRRTGDSLRDILRDQVFAIETSPTLKKIRASPRPYDYAQS